MTENHTQGYVGSSKSHGIAASPLVTLKSYMTEWLVLLLSTSIISFAFKSTLYVNPAISPSSIITRAALASWNAFSVFTIASIASLPTAFSKYR